MALSRLMWLLVPLTALAADPQRTFFVAPGGSDDDPGTEARPFRTLEKSRDAVRAINAKMTGDIAVVLRGGTYPLARTLVFGPEDSGTNGHNVIYKALDGQTPVLSGGRAVTGWTQDGARWKAKTDIPNFRQLYVNGVRAVRARGNPPPGIALHGDDGYRLPKADMAAWGNQDDVEFCYIVTWTHSRCKVKSIAREGEAPAEPRAGEKTAPPERRPPADPKGSDGAIVTMLQPHFTMARTKEGVQVKLPNYIENALELLDEPGEWYLDRKASTVYYMPRPGEDMAKAEVIAPALERLIELRGTLDKPVHSIQFVGLTFAHATWLQPSEIGHPDVQANFLNDATKLIKRSGTVTTTHNEQLKSPSNIVCHAAKAIRFEGCTFTKLGSGALDIESGSQGNAVVGCRFHDISGTAIQIGDVLKDDHHPDDPRKIVKGNSVTNCLIHDCGVEFKGSVGIFAGYTEATTIAHNEIRDLPYSGVSVGWGWGEEDAGGGAYGQKPFYDTPTTAKNNRVEFNHIHHVMRDLADGGGIYTLSIQPGTVIRGNHIHDNRGGPGGIYLDEGSGQIEIAGNLVYAVPKPMNYNNAAQKRRATCNEHDNFFNAKPEDHKPVVEAAGIEPAWRGKLKTGRPPEGGTTNPRPPEGGTTNELAVVSDYDGGDYFWVRAGHGGPAHKQPMHGMREAWVFNRAMTWLDERDGVEGAVICYSNQSPLPLTGKKQVSRWFTSKANELADIDDETTRFVKKDAKAEFDHALLPALQFHIEQHPTAELEVTEATHPWQFVVAVKGRSGPPLYASPWQDRPGKLTVELLKLFRDKGYERHFAQLTFALFVHTPPVGGASLPRANEASVAFRLRLNGQAAIIASLPVIRTGERAKVEGLPVYAVVLDEHGKRLGKDTVAVAAKVQGLDWDSTDARVPPIPLGRAVAELSEVGDGVWRGRLRGLRVPDSPAELRVTWNNAARGPLTTTLRVQLTHSGQFIGYDEKLKLLTEGGKAIGPFAGSYRGAPMFKGIGTPQESLVQGQEQWAAVQGTVHEGQHFNHGGPLYSFNWWESLTEKELDADYAYLARCGWSVVHLCQGWWLWERLDAGGRIAPHGAEQLAAVTAAARRNGLRLHLALSHYPLGKQSAPYAQYLEAGYQRGDYGKPDSKFYAMFKDYLTHFATLFRDDTGISGFTAAGEGDPDCGPAFVNAVHDFVKSRDPNHVFLCEPHHGMRTDPNSYRKAGWKPLLGGMRTYFVDKQLIESVAAQFHLAALGHVFMAEGIFWGYSGGPTQTDRYRERVRETFYTGLALRNPIMMTWEERVVEDERQVLGEVRRAVDWSKPFQRPRLAIRVGNESLPDAGGRALVRYEHALSRTPLDYACVWGDEQVPPDTLHTIDARQPFEEPAFASDGGKLPDALKAEMPLRLPQGFAATYSWSQDRTQLLAFLRSTQQVPFSASTTEAGHYTYADTTRIIELDGPIDTWEVECVKPGAIQLHVYRVEGDQMIRVGESDTVEMKQPGLNRFSLPKPISAKKGDILGCYIRSEDVHIAAESGGRMLFIEGRLADARTPLKSWEAEPKTARIAAFNAAEAARPRPPAAAPAPAAGIVLQNFPDAKLTFRLYDLAAKKPVAEGQFSKAHVLAPPAHGRHLFLLVLGEANAIRGTP
ncbi:MAG: right-handed parallel beta-helix repeat-containing protein [Planctomycetes bacterium]|nr:right-handed parallel beta-helix repeat-containing protein [Planctomycetota bacterium]